MDIYSIFHYFKHLHRNSNYAINKKAFAGGRRRPFGAAQSNASKVKNIKKI